MLLWQNAQVCLTDHTAHNLPSHISSSSITSTLVTPLEAPAPKTNTPNEAKQSQLNSDNDEDDEEFLPSEKGRGEKEKADRFGDSLSKL